MDIPGKYVPSSFESDKNASSDKDIAYSSPPLSHMIHVSIGPRSLNEVVTPPPFKSLSSHTVGTMDDLLVHCVFEK